VLKIELGLARKSKRRKCDPSVAMIPRNFAIEDRGRRAAQWAWPRSALELAPEIAFDISPEAAGAIARSGGNRGD